MYSSGTATDQSDLMSKILTFMTAIGWPVCVDDIGNTATNEYTHTFTDVPTMCASFGPIGTGGNSLSLDDAHGHTASFSSDTGSYLIMVPAHSFVAEHTARVPWYYETGHPQAATGAANVLGLGVAHLATSIPYYFFSSADGHQVAMVLGVAAGIYSYLGFGIWPTASRFGTWAGSPSGRYAFGSRPSANPRSVSGSHNAGINCPPMPPGYCDAGSNGPTLLAEVDLDGHGNEWRGAGDPTWSTTFTSRATSRVLAGWSTNQSSMGANNALTGGGGLPNLMHLAARSRSALSANVIVTPCPVSAYREITQRWSPIGTVPLVVAAITLTDILDGAQFTVGSNTYRAFNSFAVQEID